MAPKNWPGHPVMADAAVQGTLLDKVTQSQ
jgi:hypothetical protein